MSPFRPVTTGLLGGLNEDENPASLRSGELVESLNLARLGNMVGTRPGVVRPGSGEDYENAIDETNAIQGMYEHRESYDTGRHLLVIADHSSGNRVFYEDDARLPASATITPGVANSWSFATYQDKTFAAGGANNDDFWYWDGNVANSPTPITITDGDGQTLRPRYVFAWRNYVLINGLRSQATFNSENSPVVSRFCDFGTDATVATNWHAGNTIGFNAPGASRPEADARGVFFTTGFASYADNVNDYLLMLMNRRILAAVLDPTNDFVITDAIEPGCVSQRAYVNLGLDSGDGVFVSERGIHSLRQSQQFGAKTKKFLSWKIRSFFDSLNRSRLSQTVGAYDFINGRVVFAVSTGSNTSHDKLLVLDVKDQDEITADNARWSIWQLTGTTALRIQDLGMFRDANDDWHLYASTTDGDVVRFDDDVFSDLGEAYAVKMVTKHEDYGSTLREKILGDVMVTLQPGGAYQPSMRFLFDYGANTSAVRSLSMPAASGMIWGVGQWGTGQWGAARITRDAKVYGGGGGRTIAFEISHNSANEPFYVGKIDHEIMIEGESTGAAA